MEIKYNFRSRLYTIFTLKAKVNLIHISPFKFAEEIEDITFEFHYFFKQKAPEDYKKILSL